MEFGWVWSIDTPNAGDVEISIEDDWFSQSTGNFSAWHQQFYAWLYLVPFDDVALLRHQFRKTVAFARANRGRQRRVTGREENVAPLMAEDQMKALEEMDRLMALYHQVQGAGFSGGEVSTAHSKIKDFFEPSAAPEKLYSQEAKDHDVTYPGTLRGLRNMLRFGHLSALEKIFERHRITSTEIGELAKMRSDDTLQKLSRKNDLREVFIAHAKGNSPLSEGDLHSKVWEYKDLVTQTTLHRFQAHGARLGEHARLHQLMMRVMGRLADFTAIWERDCKFAFVGLLYQQTSGKLDRKHPVMAAPGRIS